MKITRNEAVREAVRVMGFDGMSPIRRDDVDEGQER